VSKTAINVTALEPPQPLGAIRMRIVATRI
jgi:hypothetical protein